MKQGTSFAGPVISFRMLISLVVTLCLSSVMLIYALPAFAASQLTVIIEGLGTASSANVLFKGQELGNQCVTDAGSRIVGDVTGGGEFSVNFFSSNNCSGTRLNGNNPIRFAVPQGSPGGMVTCTSNTSCSFNLLTNVPNNQNDAIATVLIQGLGNASSANVVFRGAQQGVCLVASDITKGQNNFSVPLNANGMFSVNFYSNTSCTAPRRNFFRFNAAQGSNGISVDCTSNTSCTSQTL